MSYVSKTLGSKEKILYQTGYHWLYSFGAMLLTLTILGLPWGLAMFIRAFATEIAVTSDRFVRKTGLISIQSEEVSLDKIEEVTVHQTILGRIFGYGNVQVHGTGMGDIKCNMVDSPVSLRREIQTAREGLKSKSE
jgi:uncharacterized membrane protein YdbT with pleckstrin-like domain